MRRRDRLDWGSGQYCTDSIRQPAQAQSKPHLYFPRRRRGFQRERTQHACPPIGPHGRPRTMPRMRRGDFDQTDRAYGRTRRRTSHVRMQSMPRAASIHRLSRERNYSCDGTLAGRPPAPRAFELPSGQPWHLTGRGFSLRAASLPGWGGLRRKDALVSTRTSTQR
jgi:hypothetical protein